MSRALRAMTSETLRQITRTPMTSSSVPSLKFALGRVIFRRMLSRRFSRKLTTDRVGGRQACRIRKVVARHCILNAR